MSIGYFNAKELENFQCTLPAADAALLMLELFLNMFLLVEADAVLPSGPGYLRWVALFGQIGALASLATWGGAGRVSI